MSFKQTKVALTDALKLSKTPVVALHGLWGTGKTHLWRETSSELEQKDNRTCLYISCMAYGTIAGLKSATIATLLSRSSGLAKHGESMFKHIVGVINKKLLPEELHLSTSLSDFQVFLPKLKKILPENTIIAFDDIERAAELDIRELLGFVSFLVDQLDVRVLLILNKEKLGDRQQAWEQLREKIVSIEIALQTRPEDCVLIGLDGIKQNHLLTFADRIQRLKITNIRTIQHMRRTYEAIAKLCIFDDEQWELLIPSVVLFVALHFNAMENAPTVEQALEPYSLFSDKDSEKSLTKEQKKAREILKDYGPLMPDAFELEVLIPYLRTGFLNSQVVTKYVKELYLRKRNAEADTAFNTFFKRYHWDSGQSPTSIIASLNDLRSYTAYLGADQVSALARTAEKLDSPALASTFTRDWIDAHMSPTSSRIEIKEHWLDLESKDNDFHPDIQAAYEMKYNQLYPTLPLREAVEHLARHEGSFSRHSRSLQDSTRVDIENLIIASDHEFRALLFGFFMPYMTGRVLGGTFQSASTHFLESCRDIVAKDPNSRITLIIRRVFEGKGVIALLAQPNPKVPQTE